MRVLVTGHLGYIGVELTPLLVSLGHDVVGLDTDYYAGCDFLAPPDPLPALPIDLRDVVPADLMGFDAVLHLAALSNDPLADLDPKLTYDINLTASIRLAQAAKAAGVSLFVFSSSCSLYGKGSDGELAEDAPFNPVTPYGESKIGVEHELAMLADRHFSPVFLRNATAYGVSRRLRADVVVNNLVCSAVTTGKVLLRTDGTPWRPLVHIFDIAQAFARVLEAPQEAVHNQAFNVGRVGQNYRVLDIANAVADLVPNSFVTHTDQAASDIRDYRVDFSKIESQLPGYRPEWDLRRGIEELHAAFSGGAMTAERFEGPEFFRVRTISHRVRNGDLDGALRWVRAPHEAWTKEPQQI